MDEMKLRSDGDVAAVDCEEEEDDVDVAEKIQFFDNKVSSLKAAITNDDVPNFINEFIWLYGSHDKEKKFEESCPYYVMDLICISSALSCATALLEDKVPGFFGEIDYPLNSKGYPLHNAAACFDYDLVELFLNHGAKTDVTNSEKPIDEKKNTRPINLALESLNQHVYLFQWFPKRDSLYKLVIILCLPQMKVALETIRLIALSTADVYEVFIDYAKKGMLIEMAALLLLMDNDDGRTSDSLDIIKGEIELLGDEIRKALVWNNGDNSSLADEMCNRMHTLMLLVIFDKAGIAIRSYLRARQSHNVTKEEVVNDVASILMDAGYELKHIDIDLSNLDCESDEIKEASGTSENITSYKSKKYQTMLLSSSDNRYTEAQGIKRELLTRKNFSSILKETFYVAKGLDIDLSNTVCKINYAMVASEKITAHIINKYYDMDLPGTTLNGLIRPYNGHRSFEPLACLPASHCVRTISTSAFIKFQENHCKGEKKAMQRRILPSTSGNILTSIAVLFKKGIRRL